MPKVVKKSEKPESSVSKELKKFLMSADSKTFPDVKREFPPGPKENMIDAVLINSNNSNKVAHQYKEPHQKLINMMRKQSDLRKKGKENIIRDISAIVNQLELDLTKFTKDQKIFQQRTIDHLKFLDHSATDISLRLQAMKDLSVEYKTKFDELENKEKEETAELCEEFKKEMKELQNNLVRETRRAQWETMCKSIIYTMHKEY